MASSSDNDETSSSDSGEDSVFYDANSSLSTPEIENSLPQREPRWRISSKDEPVKKPERYCTIQLTDKQFKDIERRDKLQRLRAQDNSANRTNQYSASKNTYESSSIVSSSKTEELSNNGDKPTKPDIVEENIDNAEIKYQDQNPTLSTSKENLSNNFIKTGDYYEENSLPPASARRASTYYPKKSSLAATSEPNIVDLTTIDRITKYGEVSPDSTKLDDEEILEQPIVLDLDTGKYIPLSDANPMTRTLMQRTSRAGSIITMRQNSIFHSRINLRKPSSDNNNVLSKSELSLAKHRKHSKIDDVENESVSSESSSTKSSHTTAVSSSSATDKSSVTTTQSPVSIKKHLKDFVTRGFLRKKKSKPVDDLQNPAEIDDEEDDAERVPINDGSNGDLKYKASRYLKEQAQFDRTQLLQTIVNAHIGPIWCMKFSPDGYLLATGGQDGFLKVWVLKSARPYFSDLSQLSSSLPNSQHGALREQFNKFHEIMSSETVTPTTNAKLGLNEAQVPFYPKPFAEMLGHQAPVLDVAWSKSLFLLSSSMDKTVRLWHITRSECLCYFLHVDFVSAIAFHPRDDRYFISASLDGHVRLWNIPDKRVVHWTLIPSQASSQVTLAEANLITAVNFCDDGRKVIVGTFDGRFLFYSDSLRYDTVIYIGDKDGSRNHRPRKGRKPSKITGIEPMNSNNSKILITSNDSRIRLFNIRTKEIERKYRGYSNTSSQIRASLSADDRYIISGSEDSWIYIWKTELSKDGESSHINAKFLKKRHRYFDRAYERIRVHNSVVTSAIFAPNSTVIMNYLYSTSSQSPPSAIRSNMSTAALMNSDSSRTRGSGPLSASSSLEGSSLTINNTGPIYVMVTADSKGQLKLLVNRYHR